MTLICNLFHISHEVLVIHIVKCVDWVVAITLELLLLVAWHNRNDRVLDEVLLAWVTLLHALLSLKHHTSVRCTKIRLLGYLLLLLLLLLRLLDLSLLACLLSSSHSTLLVMGFKCLIRSLGKIQVLFLLSSRCSLMSFTFLLLLSLLGVAASLLLRVLFIIRFLRDRRRILRRSSRSWSPHRLILGHLFLFWDGSFSLLLRLIWTHTSSLLLLRIRFKYACFLNLWLVILSWVVNRRGTIESRNCFHFTLFRRSALPRRVFRRISLPFDCVVVQWHQIL